MLMETTGIMTTGGIIHETAKNNHYRPGNGNNQNHGYRPQVNYVQSQNQGSLRRNYPRTLSNRTYYNQVLNPSMNSYEENAGNMENNSGIRQEPQTSQTISPTEIRNDEASPHLNC